MVFKKIGALGSALLLVLASVLTFAFTDNVQAVGTPLYWCDSSNGNFNSVGNPWSTNSNCSGGAQAAPVSGETLVFDDAHLSSAIDVTNNMSGLDVSSIVFECTGSPCTGSAGYSLSGNPISLDDGITDTGGNAQNNSVGMSITLNASQAFSSAGGNDQLTFSSNIALGGSSLSVTSNATSVVALDTISGSGGLTFNGPGGGSVSTYALSNPNTSYTGPVIINSGAAVQDLTGSLNALGSGAITVNSGGSLYLFSGSSTATFPNTLKLSGSGDGVDNFGSLISCLGPSSCTSANSLLTLSGNITLGANTEVVNGAYSGSLPSHSATFDFTGKGVYNGFTLTAFPSSNTIVDPPTPVVTATASSTAPKAPDTGVGLVANKSKESFIGGSLLAASFVFLAVAISKRLSKSTTSKK